MKNTITPILSKRELKLAGAKFGSFGNDSEYYAVLQSCGQSFQFIKKDDNSYKLI